MYSCRITHIISPILGSRYTTRFVLYRCRWHFYENKTAMFAMVENERPPLPEGLSKVTNYIVVDGSISQECINFLGRCFMKNPRERSTAKELRSDPWMGLTKGEFKKYYKNDNAV